MTDPHDPNSSGSIFDDNKGANDVPIEETPMEVEDAHPRRAASAEFVVDEESGSASVLREAMDPANQSLADALRLSYRVLQLVIVVLVVLFFISGFKSIENNQTGVMTRFGQIVSGESGAELTPGLEVSWPYPISEFILLPQSGAVRLADTFWPNAQIGEAPSFEAAAPAAKFGDQIRLGTGENRDGFILLEDGLGHIQMQAQYSVDDPELFLNAVAGMNSADSLVRLALERGAVHASADMKLDEILNNEVVIAAKIGEFAQSFLSDLECGIRLTEVQATKVKPPLAIETALAQLGDARTMSEKLVTESRTSQTTTLVDLVGPEYPELVSLIEQYEEAVLGAGDTGVNDPEARSLLREIDQFLMSDRIGGEIASQMAYAGAYQDEIRASLGSFASRFESLLPRYRQNPGLVVKTEWIDTYRQVIGSENAEIFHLPGNLRNVSMAITSDKAAMDRARKLRQDRAAQEAERGGVTQPWNPRLGERDVKQQLKLGEDGRVQGRNQGRN